jgi:uncharacterized membrane protein YhaH (DUF805 family)
MRTLFSVHGVAPRREWWFAYLVAVVVNMALGMALMFTDAFYRLMDVAADQPIVGALVTLMMLVLLAPTSVRRMRDRGLSPWWLAVFALWAVLSPFVVRLADDLDALILGNIIQIMGAIGSLILFVQLAVLPSKTPPPPEPAAAA